MHIWVLTVVLVSTYIIPFYPFSYSIERNPNPKYKTHPPNPPTAITNIYDGMKEAIMESVENGHRIDVEYFYRKLCTKENMILVHDKCHPNDPHRGHHVIWDEMFIFAPPINGWN